MKTMTEKKATTKQIQIVISLGLSIINILLVESYARWMTSHGMVLRVLLFLAGTACGTVLLYSFLQREDRRLKGHALILGILLAMAYVLGCRMREEGTALASLSGLPFLLIGILSLGMLAASCCAFCLTGVRQNLAKLGITEKRNRKKYGSFPVFLFYTAVIFLCWIPVFLAYYPSVFAYDAEGQLYQVIAHDYSTHHPLLHTLFLGAFFRLGEMLGSYSAGMAVHSVVQMLLMAAAFGYALLLLYKEETACWARLLLLAFFALFPTNSVLAVSTTKDVLFAALVLLYTLQLWRFASGKNQGKKDMAVQIILTVLMLLFRNNAVYALVASIPVVCVLWNRRKVQEGEKQRWKVYAIMTLMALILYAGAAAGLKAATGACNGSPREMLSVPLQQMARTRVCHEAEIEPQLRAELEQYLSSEWVFAAYNPHLADPVKLRAVIHDNPAGFLKTWVKLGVCFPQTYMDAFLDNSVGYWFLEDTSHAAIYGVGTENGFGYLSTDNRQMPAGCEIVPHSYLPGVRVFMEQIVSENQYQKIPVLSVIFAPAFYWWLLALYVTKASYQRRYDRMIAAVFPVIYYLTLLLSPTVLIRYMYPFVVTVPVLLGLMTAPADKTDKNQKNTQEKLKFD